jgi:hypothetical protein
MQRWANYPAQSLTLCDGQRLELMWRSTAIAWLRATPGNHSMNSSIVAPARRFSKRAETGTRVPTKTQLPFMRIGSASTALQAFQFIGSPTQKSAKWVTDSAINRTIVQIVTRWPFALFRNPLSRRNASEFAVLVHPTRQQRHLSAKAERCQ